MESEIHNSLRSVGNCVSLDQEEAPLRIVPDTIYTSKYRLEWKDKSKSVRYWDPELKPHKDKGPHIYGLYNLTRAKDILRNWRSYLDDYNQRDRLPILKGAT